MSMLHQETWVRFGTNGIGLSDHQNRYSNGVRISNWVENEFGDHLRKTASQRPPQAFPQSSTQIDYKGAAPELQGTVPIPLGVLKTNASWNHGPEGSENTRLLTSTYDLTMCHAEGPRRVDTMLWSGITKVDKNVPTGLAERVSLLEKKKTEWAAQRETPWKTAYTQQFVKTEAEWEPKHVVPRRKDDYNFSSDARPHVAMALREYG